MRAKVHCRPAKRSSVSRRRSAPAPARRTSGAASQHRADRRARPARDATRFIGAPRQLEQQVLRALDRSARSRARPAPRAWPRLVARLRAGPRRDRRAPTARSIGPAASATRNIRTASAVCPAARAMRPSAVCDGASNGSTATTRCSAIAQTSAILRRIEQADELAGGVDVGVILRGHACRAPAAALRLVALRRAPPRRSACTGFRRR